MKNYEALAKRLNMATNLFVIIVTEEKTFCSANIVWVFVWLGASEKCNFNVLFSCVLFLSHKTCCCWFFFWFRYELHVASRVYELLTILKLIKISFSFTIGAYESLNHDSIINMYMNPLERARTHSSDARTIESVHVIKPVKLIRSSSKHKFFGVDCLQKR